MKAAHDVASVSTPAPPPPRARSLVRGLLLHGVLHPLIAVAAFGAYEHFKLAGESTTSFACLVAAGAFGLAPVRALARELLAIEGGVLHLVHGVGGLAVVGLGLSGVVSGEPILDHAAMAPFAIMGAAQAMMHADHPRSREEAEALRRFATSLPEVQRFTRSRDLTSPTNAREAVAVLTDLVSKAQALGETELRSDPGFQSAVRRVTTRFGLSLGLDTVDQAIEKLSADPAARKALPDLRKRVAAARKTIARADSPATPR
jgi:hypothetical protein